LNNLSGFPNVLRIHLPEWRDSLAVNQEIRRALLSGRTNVHLTGARGDRLLLNGLTGSFEARIRIDGDVGTELARDLNAENLFVVVNGSVGSGTGMGMKAGTLCITGTSGALLGTQMQGGDIWAMSLVGSRAGYRATGGTLRTIHPPGPLLLDRSHGMHYGKIDADAPDLGGIKAVIEEINAWPEPIE